MVKNRKTPSKSKPEVAVKKKKWLFAAIPAAAVAIAVAVILIVYFASHGRVVARIGGITVREDMYRYFLSYGKYTYYKNNAGVGDEPITSDAFWQADNEEGITHLEACLAFSEEYMISLLTAASAFESGGGSLTEAERASLTDRLDDHLQNRGMTKKEYNALAKEHGFSYSTVRRVLLYTAEADKLMETLTAGTTLTEAQLTEYYELAYTRALLLEIRTQNRYSLDSDGNPVVGPDGALVELTPEERAAALERIAAVRAALEADGSIECFEELMKTYNEDVNRGEYTDGYYFSDSSEFSVSVFSEPELLSQILALPTGQWLSYETGVSTIFVFASGATDRPWLLDENQDFFNDFSEHAGMHAYVSLIEQAIEEEGASIRRSVTDRISPDRVETNYLLYVE